MLGEPLLESIKLMCLSDVLGEETRSMSNLRIMGDQFCRSCSNHFMYCGEQVKLKVIP